MSSQDRYHHRDLPRTLVEAAVAEITRTGRTDFTLRSLARAIGVTHAAPYAHFASKEALLTEVRRIGFEQLARATRAAGDDVSDPLERLLAIGAAYVRFGTLNPGIYSLMFGGSAPSTPDLDAARAASARILDDAVGAVVSGDDVRQRRDAAVAAWSLTHGLTSLINDGRVPHPDETHVRAILQSFVPSLLVRNEDLDRADSSAD